MMAEFQEVMKQWKRMCDTCSKVKQEHGACGCFPAGNYAVCSMKEMSKEAELALDDRYFEWIGMMIMAWAAKHPEPVYPTWVEWLTEQEVLRQVRTTSYSGPINGCVDSLVQYIRTDKMFQPIPDDIAEKLGLNPKKG